MNLCFGITVGQAVRQYQLDYKPPGYYFRQLSDSTRMSIEYAHQMDDFNNEYQPATALYGRVINTYSFKFSDQPGRFNKELTLLKSSLAIDMTVSEQVAGLVHSLSASTVNNMPTKGRFAMAQGWTKDSVAVYLREIPRTSSREKPMLQVLFFKGKGPQEINARVHAMQ